MVFLEKELEGMLWDMLEDFRGLLKDRGLPIEDDYDWHYYRQLNLNKYGIADIVGFKLVKLDNGKLDIFVHIIELKKDEINYKALGQACRYAVGVMYTLFEKYKPEQCEGAEISFRLSLIGTTFNENSDFVFLPTIVNCKCLVVDYYTAYFCPLEGISFKERGPYSIGENKDLPYEIYNLPPFTKNP